MIHYLDPRTIFLISTLITVLMTIVLFAISKGVEGIVGGVYSYAYAYLSYSCFAILILLRDYLPAFFSIFLADLVLALSILLIYDGLCRSKRKQINQIFYRYYFGLNIVLIAFSTFVYESLSGRLLISMLDTVVIFGLCLWLLGRREQQKWQLGELITGLALFIAVLAALIQIVDTIHSAMWFSEHSIFAFEGSQAISLIINLLAVIFIALGLIAMSQESLRRDLEKLASYDALTGVHTRRVILNVLDKSIAKVARTGHPLGLIMVDLDHFKDINDSYGHRVGDQVLTTLVHAIEGVLRKDTYIGRYGGEEFLIIMPDTDKAQLDEVCERVRSAAEKTQIKVSHQQIICTVSLGALTLDGDNVEYITDPIVLADKALYQAKQRGRNQYVIMENSVIGEKKVAN